MTARSPCQVAGVEVAEQAEVEQAQPSVRAQEAVVRVRVAGDDPLAPRELEVEAEDDLADAIALGLPEALDLLAPQPLDVLGHQHAARREIRVDARHPDVRVPAEQPREPALVLGLQLVVELVGDPLADLGQHRGRVELRGEALEERARPARGCAGRPRRPPPLLGAGP